VPSQGVEEEEVAFPFASYLEVEVASP